VAKCLFTFVFKKEEMREIHLIFVVDCWCILIFYLYLHQYISNRKWCACNDNDIQGVESGKFKLEIMNMISQSEFTPCIGRGFLFLLFLISGFTRTLLLENVEGEVCAFPFYLNNNIK
jgi:hypothetical protein